MNKAGGFITLHRQILEWEWYKNSATKDLFLHLLLTANFADSTVRGTEVKRGQVLTSLTDISTGTGLSNQQARTALSHLKSTGEITDEYTNQYRLITIVKYDDYQTLTGKSTGNQQATNRQTNRQDSENQQANQHQYNKYNNNIYNNKTKEQYNDSPSSGNDFDLFWTEYPKKVAKREAQKAWDKLKPDPDLLYKITCGLEMWKKSDQWTRNDGRYIPYPATWLNRRAWEDDVQPASVAEERKPERKPGKVVVAQQYEQRDYSDIQAQVQADMDREIEEYLRRNGGGNA